MPITTRWVTLKILCRNCDTNPHSLYLNNTDKYKCDECGNVPLRVTYEEKGPNE